MNSKHKKALGVFAPAKINLYLHLTGKRDDGYHFLDSLVAFADVGDVVTISPAEEFCFEIEGPFAKDFNAKENDASPDSANLAVRAAWALAYAAQKALKLQLKLTKNIPLSAGLGGGSADAAAVLWGLCEWWEITRDAPFLMNLMTGLGADVPACFFSKPARMRGVGEILHSAPDFDEIPVLLANPGALCPTEKVFGRYKGLFRQQIYLPDSFSSPDALIKFLREQRNDLESAACEVVPDIKSVLKTMRAQKGCSLARLSGSGATCFGLFENESCRNAAISALADLYPAWWLYAGWLNDQRFLNRKLKATTANAANETAINAHGKYMK